MRPDSINTSLDPRLSAKEHQIVNPLIFSGWDEFVLAHRDHTVFHSSAWARVLADTYGYVPSYLLAMRHGSVAGLVPLMEVNSLVTGRRAVSLPFSDYCGPLLYGGIPAASTIDMIIRCGKKAGWRSFEIRCREPLLEISTPSTSYIHHELRLEGGEEKVFRGFRPATQRNVRKALKGDVEVSVSNSTESLEEFYRLNCLTRRHHGLPPQPPAFFRNLHQHVLAEGTGFVVIARWQGASVSAAVFLHFGNKAYYKYGASDLRVQHLRANNLVMWEAIRTFLRKGFPTLCLGRSEPENEGLRQFKNGWGARESWIHYYKYEFKKGKYAEIRPRTTGFHNHLFRHLPLSVSRMIGTALYRHMG